MSSRFRCTQLSQTARCTYLSCPTIASPVYTFIFDPPPERALLIPKPLQLSFVISKVVQSVQPTLRALQAARPSAATNMNSHSSDISVLSSRILSLIQQYKFPLLTILSLPILSIAYVDYSGWYGMGAGGIPHNVFGWLVQSLLRLRASGDRRSIACYDKLKSSKLERETFLDGELPKRAHPSTSPWVAPHRQLEEMASEKLRQVGTNPPSRSPTHQSIFDERQHYRVYSCQTSLIGISLCFLE